MSPSVCHPPAEGFWSSTLALRLRSSSTSIRCGPGSRSRSPPTTPARARPSGARRCGWSTAKPTCRRQNRSYGVGAEVMAEGAARPVAVPSIGVGVLLLLLVLIGLLFGAAAMLLVGCVVAGFGITYLSRVALNFEERLAFGTVLGAMAVSLVSFGLSMLVRDVTVATVLAGVAIAAVAGVGAALANREQASADLLDAIA